MGKPNKKEQASLQMRHNILSTTIEILGTEGYAQVTASNLSKKAGISKGALYHHFANLDEIRFAALALLIDKFMETNDPARFKSLENFLEATSEMMVSSMKEYPIDFKALYVFITQAFFDDAAKSQLQTLVNHALDQYLQAFQFFCPELDKEELSGLVRIVDAYFGGSVLQWYIMDDPSASRASWQQFNQLVLQHIAAKNSV